MANLRLRLESTKTAPLDHTKSESDVNNADNPKKDGEDQIENLKQRVALLESQLEAAQLMVCISNDHVKRPSSTEYHFSALQNQHGNQSDDPIGLKINEVKHLQGKIYWIFYPWLMFFHHSFAWIVRSSKCRKHGLVTKYCITIFVCLSWFGFSCFFLLFLEFIINDRFFHFVFFVSFPFVCVTITFKFVRLITSPGIGSCTWDCYLYREQLACCILILRGELTLGSLPSPRLFMMAC